MISLVVINDLDVIGIPAPPDEADAPLIVDSDGILARTITTQFLKPVSRRNAQVLDPVRRVDHGQLAQGRPLQIGGQFPDGPAMEQILSPLIPKAFDHDSFP